VPQRSRVEAVIRTLSFSGRGTIQVMLDGQPLGKPMDLYTAGAPRSVETTLGSLTLSPGEHRLRFVVVGRNEASDAYTFAVSEIGFYRAGERRQARTLPAASACSSRPGYRPRWTATRRPWASTCHPAPTMTRP